MLKYTVFLWYKNCWHFVYISSGWLGGGGGGIEGLWKINTSNSQIKPISDKKKSWAVLTHVHVKFTFPRTYRSCRVKWRKDQYVHSVQVYFFSRDEKRNPTDEPTRDETESWAKRLKTRTAEWFPTLSQRPLTKLWSSSFDSFGVSIL